VLPQNPVVLLMQAHCVLERRNFSMAIDEGEIEVVNYTETVAA
jgi:hypothetical protein